MAAQSFKNYVVRYNLTVDPGAAIKSIETLRTAADKAWAPLDGVARALETISAHFTKLKQASSFEFKPAVNLSVFKKQCGEMEAVAKQTAERISAILNGSLTAAPLGKATKPSTKGGEKKRKNTITRTVDQLKKERDDIRKSLKVFGPGAVSRENTKAYKNILSRYEKDIASLRAIQEKRKVLAQINNDIAAANKSKSKSITKKIGKSTVATIVKGAEESVKKGGGTSANILKSFNAALSGLVGKQSVKIPVSIVVPEGIKGQLAAAIKRMEAGITVNIPVKAVPVQSGKQSGNAANGLSKKDNRLLTTLQNRVAANEAKRETAKGAVKGGLTTSINRDKAKINALLSKGGVSSGQPRGAITEAMTRVQGLANTKPIRLSTVFVPDGQAGFGLSMDIFKLQELANTKPIKISTVLVPNGQAGFGLRMDIFKLQELANLTPVRIPVVGTPVTATGKAAATGAVQKNVKMAGTTGLQPLPANANNAKPTKTITPGISAANINNKAEALIKLNAALSKLPPSLDRSYTIKLSVTGVERKIAQLERLIPLLSKLPADMSKIYNVSATGNIGNTGNNGTASQSRSSYISASGFGNRSVITPRNARKVSMNSLGYQIFGNTSFGARTPMFLDMMKGMGVMTGVGAAMSTISNAFSHAAEYQNTMLTAQAILKENYKGTNFYGDFNEMTGIVRDVAKRTKFTAPQAADAARFMAMAGLNIPMINAAISPIADVAVIGDNDLGEVADKMTNIMTAFNLKPQNMRHLADALTKTFTSTNTDMMMLAESMQYAAPMAHLAGANVEEALAMIGIMGNAGIQGSMAGTTLRMMYQNIIKPNKNQAKMWAKLGIKTTDENGHTRNIIDVLSDLRGKLSFKDAKDIEGNWKDEGTPVAKAVSELFRVTASAGAGTLLENLDKVKALAEANRTVTSLSESVSQVKQNDVKGMWAKLTSAFTDAVVTEFESSDGVIKKYLGDITKYLASDEFKGTLHEIFNLVVSLAKVMGQVAKIWRFLISNFGGLYKYILQAQFFVHQVAFLLTPFRQLFQLGARTAGFLGIGGAIGGTATASASFAGAAPMAIAAASGYVPGVGRALMGNTASGYYLKGLNMAGKNAIHTGIRMGGREILSTAALDALILRRQLAVTAAGYRINDAVIKRIENRGGFWNMAYTNPQKAASHAMMPRRDASIAKQMAQIAVMQAALDKARNAVAERGAERRSTRFLRADTINRARQMGRISQWRGYGLAMSSGVRQAATWVPSFVGISALQNGLTSTIRILGKCLGALVNPLTLTAAAVGGVLLAFNKMGKNIEEANRRFNAQNKRDIAVTGGVAASLGGRTTNEVINDRNKIGAGPLQLGLIKPLGQTEAPSRYSLNPMLRNTRGVSSIFRNADANDFIPYATQLLSDMSPMVYGKRVPHYKVAGLYERTNAASGSYKSFVDKEALQKDAVKAALMLVGATSPEAKSASSSIIAMLQDWEKITDKGQSAVMFQQIMENARQAAAKFNPAGRNLAHFSDTYSVNEIGSMRYGKAMTSWEAQQGAYEAVMDITNPNSPLYGRWAAINELRNGVEVGTQQWYDNVAKIAGAMQMQVVDKSGNVRDLLLQFDNSKITWEAFKSRMEALNIQVDDDIATYQGIIVQAYQNMKNMVDKAGTGMVSVEQFVNNNGIKLPKGWTLTMTQQQLSSWQQKVITNWESNDPAFKAIRAKYGTQEAFVKSTNGVKTGWGPWANDNRPTDREVEDVENAIIKRRLNETQKGKGGGNKDQAYAIPQTINQKPYSGANYMPQSRTSSGNGVNVNIDMNNWSVGNDANTREIAQVVQDAVVNAMTVAIG